MDKSRSNIWSYDTTGSPNVGLWFHHFMDAATTAPKNSNQNKIFNSFVILSDPAKAVLIPKNS